MNKSIEAKVPPKDYSSMGYLSNVSLAETPQPLGNVSTILLHVGAGLRTIDKLLWLLANNPVACVNIYQLEPREEAADDGQCLVTNVVAICPPHE